MAQKWNQKLFITTECNISGKSKLPTAPNFKWLVTSATVLTLHVQALGLNECKS
jgi:hypothetical protein